MKNIAVSVVGELAGIGRNFFRTIWEESFFPPRALPIEEQLLKKVRLQKGMMRSQQEVNTFQAGVVVRKEREIARLTQLLAQKDKELDRARSQIRSLELWLQNETSRNRRKR